MIDQLESRLTRALTARAELEEITAPDPAYFTSQTGDDSPANPKHRSALIAAAAASLVVVGLAVLATRSTSQDIAATDSATTSPDQPAAANTSGSDEGTDPWEQGLEELGLPSPGPLLEADPLHWQEVLGPDGVSQVNSIEYVGDRVFALTDQSAWAWTKAAGWSQISSPDAGQIQQFLAAPGGATEAISVAPTGTLSLWDLNDQFRMTNPVELNTGISPAPVTDNPFVTWTQLRLLRFAYLEDQLVMTTTHVLELDLGDLLRQRGILKADEEICDFTTGKTWLHVKISTLVVGDGSCRFDPNLRDEEHTPESLAISKSDFLLIYGERIEEFRTVVSLVHPLDDPVALTEMDGHWADLAAVGDDLTVSTWDQLGHWRVARSVGTALDQPWAQRGIPGTAVLGNTSDGYYYVLTSGSVLQLDGPDGDQNLGSLEESESFGSFWATDGGSGGVAVITAPKDLSGPVTVLVSTNDGQSWSSIDVGSSFGRHWAVAAVGESDVMLAVTDENGGSLTFYLAELPNS